MDVKYPNIYRRTPSKNDGKRKIFEKEMSRTFCG